VYFSAAQQQVIVCEGLMMSKSELEKLLERVETRLCEWRNCFAGHDLPYDLSDMQKLCEVVREYHNALGVLDSPKLYKHPEYADPALFALDRAEKIAGGNELPQPSFEEDDDDDI
jgi:hypothetical protein